MFGFNQGGNLYGGLSNLNGINHIQQPQHQQIQQQQIQPQLKNMVKCRMVTSLDEVKAAAIDFDGSLNAYIDVTNNKIYTKIFTVNGTVDIKVYTLAENENNQPKYATMEEIENLKKELEDLKNSLGG